MVAGFAGVFLLHWVFKKDGPKLSYMRYILMKPTIVSVPGSRELISVS